MKKSVQLILAAICLTCTLSWISCDKVDDPYETNIVNIEGNRKVLLEDYTAIRCINCPAAADLAHEINNTYNDKVIIISIHGGNLATPIPNDSLFNFDLRTPEGAEYYNFYNIQAQPIGVIDKLRDTINHSYPTQQTTKWQEVIAERLIKISPVELSMESNIIEGKLNVRVNYTAVAEMPEKDDYKLLLYFVEDGVITGQKNSNPKYGTVPNIVNYVHHNVLRGTINGTWGSSIETPSFAESSLLFVDYAIPNYDATATYKVIAIIYDENEVLQAEEFVVQ